MSWREVKTDKNGNIRVIQLDDIDVTIEIASTMKVEDYWNVIFSDIFQNADSIDSFIDSRWEMKKVEFDDVVIIFGLMENGDFIDSFRIFCESIESFSRNLNVIKEKLITFNFEELRLITFNIGDIVVTGKHSKYMKYYMMNDRVIFLTRDSIIIVWEGNDSACDDAMDRLDFEVNGRFYHAVGSWNVGYSHKVLDEIHIEEVG